MTNPETGSLKAQLNMVQAHRRIYGHIRQVLPVESTAGASQILSTG